MGRRERGGKETNTHMVDAGVTAEVGTFLEQYGPEVRAIALGLRRVVLEIVPGAIEQVDLPAKMLAYGFALTYKDTVCVIAPQKGWVNLGFPRGADMSDPTGLLTGTGKRARHVRITNADQAQEADVRALIEEAARSLKRSSP